MTSIYDKVGTKVLHQENQMQVVYRDTPIVTFTSKKVILQNRGWFTATTMRRMNQASKEFGLGFRVFQKDWIWYVDIGDQVVPYVESMEFLRV